MRIAGINIPDEKPIEISLTYIYGIGRAAARTIVAESGIRNKRAKELSSDELHIIQGILERKYKIEGELRQVVRQHLSRLKEIQSYRGLRHVRKLPVRGQRTRTNSRTVRGNIRKTAGSGKRKVDLK